MAAATPQKPQRFLSLDVVRGLTIAFMIMVNNNGGDGSWSFMNHKPWNGYSPTDLVFPTFVFVVGASIVFATQARLAKGASRSLIARHTILRAVMLFLFGVIVNSFPFFKLDHMRFYGVLQRIAVCYLVVALFYLFDRRVWTKVVALLVTLVGYWALLWAPVPGVGMPGKQIPFMDKEQNIVSYVDRALMPGHLYLDWDGPNAHNVRDPEGLLSDIPAIGTCLLGLLAGLWLRSDRTLQQKATGLAVAAATLLALGYLWNNWFPFNKNLWTSSYVCVAAGWSTTVLTLAFVAVELLGIGRDKSKWAVYPWIVFGSNAITAYMFSELVPGIVGHLPFQSGGEKINFFDWMQTNLFDRVDDPGWAAFCFAAWFAAVCFIPVWLMYRKRIFLKV